MCSYDWTSVTSLLDIDNPVTQQLLGSMPCHSHRDVSRPCYPSPPTVWLAPLLPPWVANVSCVLVIDVPTDQRPLPPPPDSSCLLGGEQSVVCIGSWCLYMSSSGCSPLGGEYCVACFGFPFLLLLDWFPFCLMQGPLCHPLFYP